MILVLTLLGVVIVSFEARRAFVRGRFLFDLMLSASLWYMLSYVVIPVVYLASPGFISFEWYKGLLNFEVGDREIVAILGGWPLIAASHQFCSRITPAQYAMFFRRADEVSHQDTTFVSIALIGGLFSYFLFVAIYGVQVLWTNVRFGAVEGNHWGALFLKLSQLVVVSAGAYGAVFLSRMKTECSVRERAIGVAMLGALVSLAFARSIQGASREAMSLIFIVLLLIAATIRGARVLLKYGVLVGAVSVFFLSFGRSEFAYGIYNEGFEGVVSGVANTAAKEGSGAALVRSASAFSHPIASLYAAFDSVDSGITGYRFFIDLPIAVLFYLRLVGVNVPDSVAYVNTYYLSGVYKSYVPPGILGLGVYSLGYVGVGVVCALFGAVSAFVDRTFIKGVGPANLACYTFISWSIGKFVQQGEPRVLSLNILPVVIAFIALRCLGRRRLTLPLNRNRR